MSPEIDAIRLLNQLDRIRYLMFDGEWRTLGEISSKTSVPETSVSAVLRSLRRPENGGFIVERRSRADRTNARYEYRVVESAA